MSEKEKIRAEVERRIKSLESNIGYGIGVDSQIDAYESLLSFIDTLPEEKLSNVERIGKDCKEWSVSEDLEEAAVEAFKKIVDSDKNNFLEIFNAGAKWQKDKMVQNTIDAHCFGFQGAALFSFRLPAGNYLVGSEVKVIVIK